MSSSSVLPAQPTPVAFAAPQAPGVSHTLYRAGTDTPEWRSLLRELRTDHAGETGAVMIYRGILAVSRHPQVHAFAHHHLAAEQRHLELIEALVPHAGRSRLIPLWKISGWLTGALPALFGPKAVFATIEAVETFVDRHYAEQLQLIDTLLAQVAQSEHLAQSQGQSQSQALNHLRAWLDECRLDEVAHRDDARQHQAQALNTQRQAAHLLGRVALRLWTQVVAVGSVQAVKVCRWV